MSLHSFSPDIAEHLHAVRQRMDVAAVAAGRRPDDVHLIAVSKTKPADLVRAAAGAGCRDFGENYLQEAIPKILELSDLNASWHFIGAIQSNKTRAIARHFQWVHTVSREKIAERLSSQCPADKTLDVTIQVNIDDDPAKAGVSPEEAPALLDAIGGLPRIRVRGLMTILQQDSRPDGYRRLAELFEELCPRAPRPWDTLSMGMSGDFEEAIAAGATHVRVGTAVFGARDRA